jgi:tetratricopeptide (TPR) repeat protein
MRLAAAFACAIAISTAAFAQVTAGRSGWDAIREGRNEEAATAFAEAIRAEPRDPSLHVGAGLAAQLLGDNAKARDSFEQALKLAPNFTTASLLLGDLLYRQSDLQGAINVFEAAAKYAPGDKTLADRLARLRAEPSPEKGFFQSPSAHFTVSAPRSTRFLITSSPWCSTRKSSSATRRARPPGRRPPTTGASGSRCAARSNRRPASSSACSRTS